MAVIDICFDNIDNLVKFNELCGSRSIQMRISMPLLVGNVEPVLAGAVESRTITEVTAQARVALEKSLPLCGNVVDTTNEMFRNPET